jgi:hypothetical protein
VLGGAAVGAAVGGFSGALIGVRIPEFEAKRLTGKLFGSNFLVSVHTEHAGQRSHVREIFKHAKAQDICSASESRVNPG